MDNSTAQYQKDIFNRFKDVIQWFPAIYAITTVFGFVNYYTLFKPFGINISDYLTAGEMLMAFLPASIPMLIALPIVLVLTLLYSSLRDEIEPTFIDDDGLDEHQKKARLENYHRSMQEIYKRTPPTSLVQIWKELFVEIKMDNRSFLSIFLTLFVALSISIIHLMVMLGIYNIVKGAIVGGSMWLPYNISPRWLIFCSVNLFILRYYATLRSGAAIIRRPLIDVPMLALLVLGIVNVTNRDRASHLVDGQTQQVFRLETNTRTIASGDSMVYVGRIDAGIFLFNKLHGTHTFYPSSTIQSLTLFEIDHWKKYIQPIVRE